MTGRAEYEPFGNIYEMREGKRTDQPLRFPGQEVAMNWEGQEENYNIFRWYRSGWGRYTQADAVTPTVAPYTYAGGNPLFFIDPLGLVTQKGPETIYHHVDKSTMWTNCMKKGGIVPIFPYGCTNPKGGVHCKCTCSDQTWKLAVTTWMRQDVWYADVVNKNTNELIPADLVRAEETKHVFENIKRYEMLYGAAVAAEAVQYSSKKACYKACGKLIKYMDQLFKASEGYVHDTDPHPY